MPRLRNEQRLSNPLKIPPDWQPHVKARRQWLVTDRNLRVAHWLRRRNLPHAKAEPAPEPAARSPFRRLHCVVPLGLSCQKSRPCRRCTFEDGRQHERVTAARKAMTIVMAPHPAHPLTQVRVGR